MPRFVRPEVGEINAELTVHLQDLALGAWQKGWPHRTDAELRHQFNPNDAEHIGMVLDVYRRYAEWGGLTLAFAYGHHAPIGFALSKERHQAHDVYEDHVVLRQISIDADHQGQGHSTQLAAAALSLYPRELPVVTLIPDEAEAAISAALALGFSLSSKDQKRKRHQLFGKGSKATRQYRFESPSIASVIEIALAKARLDTRAGLLHNST